MVKELWARYIKDERTMPLLLVPALAAIGFLLIGSGSTWLTLTVAGLATGMMIFIIASGLTLIFGLMDVLNFGHGAFIGLGAYLAYTILSSSPDLVHSPSLANNMMALGLAIGVAAIGAGLLGLLFEQLIIRGVYGDHLKQILITMGGMIVVEQIITMVWGANELQIDMPATLKGAVAMGGASIEKYRIVVIAFGTLLLGAILLVLMKTRIGLLIRAGVEDAEMVEALGFRIRRIFVGVFVTGSALAGFGGVMWALYRGSLASNMGSELMIMVFIVIVIGGLGSIGGCFVGAVLVAVTSNYVAFLAPRVAIASTIVLMMAVLFWRPNGLFPVVKK